jgi:Tol biopolymer transport system component/DNA-binding winged helix-turn-helix (wHTH) protein
METAIRPETSIRFQDFELDLRTRELYRNGSRLRIRGHPVDVLAILLEHPGELVTRDTLQKRIWPDDTFVDFEQILNNSVGKLRDVLGDKAESPHFIETLPRMGYRFIGSIDRNGVDANHSVPLPFPVLTESAVSTADPIRRSTAIRHWPIWTAIGLTSALCALGYWYVRRPLPTPSVTFYEQLTLDGAQKHVAGTDGNRIYLWTRAPRITIAQIPLSGGSLTEIPIDLPQGSGFATGLTDVSPDGSSLLVRGRYKREEGDANWIVGSAGHPVRYLTKAYGAAWSPDGKTIVFTNAHGDFYTVGSDADTPQLLYRDEGPPDQVVRAGAMQWSPDGKTIRLTRVGKGLAIWEISSTGKGLHEFLPHWNVSAAKCCGRWTPDGRFYVFLAGSGLAKGPTVLPLAQIWVYDERRGILHPKARYPIPLALGPLLWGDPVPSRDGKKIFARGVSLRGELERYDRNSNRLEPFLNGISAEMLDFSRDGRFVAYVTFPEGILWRANRDGSGTVQLTKPPLYARSPRWSPDGTKILFASNTQYGVDHLYLISPDGGAPELLLPDEPGPLTLGDWSPDGKRVVFTTFPGYSFVPTNVSKMETRIVELATGKVTTLPKWSGGSTAPLWSPDGRFIAEQPIGAMSLLIFDLEKQTWNALPQENAVGFHNWSHDGKFLYYFCKIGNKRGVYRITPRGGKKELVVELPQDFRGTGWYSFWMSLDPDDVPILFRDVGTDEIYALTLSEK